MWMWKMIMKILGLGKPSEEELVQTLYDIAWANVSGRFRVDRLFLSEGKEGYAEARQLLGSYAGRGFQEPKMYLSWLPDHRRRDTHQLGWVSNAWTCIIVHVGKTYPKT